MVLWLKSVQIWENAAGTLGSLHADCRLGSIGLYLVLADTLWVKIQLLLGGVISYSLPIYGQAFSRLSSTAHNNWSNFLLLGWRYEHPAEAHPFLLWTHRLVPAVFSAKDEFTVDDGVAATVQLPMCRADTPTARVRQLWITSFLISFVPGWHNLRAQVSSQEYQTRSTRGGGG